MMPSPHLAKAARDTAKTSDRNASRRLMNRIQTAKPFTPTATWNSRARSISLRSVRRLRAEPQPQTDGDAGVRIPVDRSAGRSCALAVPARLRFGRTGLPVQAMYSCAFPPGPESSFRTTRSSVCASRCPVSSSCSRSSRAGSREILVLAPLAIGVFTTGLFPAASTETRELTGLSSGPR